MNTYFVQLEKKVGMPKVRDMAQRLGVRSPSLDGDAALVGSLTLGSREVSPLDMATAYSTIAAHGLRCYPKPVLSMVTSTGKPVAYSGPPKCQQVLKPADRRHHHQPADGSHPVRHRCRQRADLPPGSRQDGNHRPALRRLVRGLHPAAGRRCLGGRRA